MVPVLSFHVSIPPLLSPSSFPLFTPFKSSPHRSLRFPFLSLPGNPFQRPFSAPVSITNSNVNDLPNQQQQQQPRTLFPGGYKRPEIKVPNLVLQLQPEDVLSPDSGALDLIDKAVSEFVGIVVLNGGFDGSSSGKTIYEAGCLLKSVVKDRAYLLISERVDIASAVNASGVVLSDQGLPAIVARNMMMDSKSESVLLPLVARIVQTPMAAINASNSEGADFLIYSPEQEEHFDLKWYSGFTDVKIPIFLSYSSSKAAVSVTEASELLKSGPAGLVLSLEDLRLFSDDSLSRLLYSISTTENKLENEVGSLNEHGVLDVGNDVHGKKMVAGFVNVEDREKQLIESERSILLQAINVIQKAAPQMEEVSLLVDAVSQIDEPFLLAIVGEFNSGKSTVINALLGERYLKEGVVPTTNEITFLRYSDNNSEEPQRCERHPDGQFICYLPAPILEEMNIVDTPGTNVILQRQQRLTEEFVPRADLLLFVISADRPLTESEVAFLRYTQQWRKKVVFVLNKSDLYQSASELEEAISFIKDNTKKLLNSKNIIIYPVSARSALEAKLASSSNAKNNNESPVLESHWKTSSFNEFEKFLYSFLDGSTQTGIERMKLKLETPIAIADRILSSCEAFIKQERQLTEQDLATLIETVDSVKEYSVKIEKECIPWRRKILSLIETTKSRVLELIESTLQISNLDLATSYMLKGEKSTMTPTSSRVQNDIITPAVSDAQRLLEEYALWLHSTGAHEGKLYKESFEDRWPSIINPNTQKHFETYRLLEKVDDLGLKAIDNFDAGAASKLFEQEIREVYLGTFGGLGAAGFSASLLTSVLPTTLEDLLALGLCSAGGFIVISNFPNRKRGMINKVTRIADGLMREVEEAMQKDLLETVASLENFVKTISKPYQDAAQQRLDELLNIQNELSEVIQELRTLQVDIQNLHVS